MAQAYDGEVLATPPSGGAQPYEGEVLAAPPQTAEKSTVAKLVDHTISGPRAVAETGLSLATGAVAMPTAGLSGIGAALVKALGITDTDPADVVRKVQEALTYQPSSAGGQALTSVVAYPFEKLAEGADAVGGKVTDVTGSPLLGAAVNTGIQALPMVAGKVAPVGKTALANRAARRAVEEAPFREQVKAATDAGFVLTPNEAKAGIISRSAEGLSGSAKLQKGGSAKNQTTVNKLIREDIGLDENTPAKPEAIQALIDEAHKPYEAVKKVGKFDNDEQFLADVDKVTASRDTAAESYPHRQKPTGDEAKFLETVQGLKETTSPTTASAVEEVKLLRAESKKMYRGGDTTLGDQYLALAQAVDDAMSRAIEARVATGDLPPDLAGSVAKYREARQKIAKAYQAERALGGDGNFDANVYAKMLDANVPLSGPALTVANFAKNFPKLAQQAQKVGHYGLDFGDLMLSVLSGGGGVLATHAATGGAGAAALVARPVTRAVLMSRPVQRAITSPRSAEISQMALDAQSSPAVVGAEMGAEQRRRLVDQANSQLYGP